MTYEEFKRELYKNITQQVQQEGDVHIRLLERRSLCTDADTMRMIRFVNMQMYGTSGVILQQDMLCAVWGKSQYATFLFWPVRPLYERYKKEGWQSILPELLSKLKHEKTRTLSLGGSNYEQMRDRLIVRPINYQYHKEDLEECIYWRFGDIALVLYRVIYDMDEDYMTMKINHFMAKDWGLSDDTLLTNALLNSVRMMPPRLYYGTDLRQSYSEDEGVFMEGENGKCTQIHREDALEGLHGYRLTTTKRINGAIALFYPGVKERLAELMEGDYYVGFTSIHEAVIHPVQHKVLGEMKSAIQHTNAVFDEREMLTNRVYRYSSARTELIEM